MSNRWANDYAVRLEQNFKLCVENGCGIFLLSERCRFFCDWVQDSVVNLFCRNEAFLRNVEEWGGTGYNEMI